MLACWHVGMQVPVVTVGVKFEVWTSCALRFQKTGSLARVVLDRSVRVTRTVLKRCQNLLLHNAIILFQKVRQRFQVPAKVSRHECA